MTDCVETLYGMSGHNQGLLSFLVDCKKQGHSVFIVSKKPEQIGNLVELLLKNSGQKPKLFHHGGKQVFAKSKIEEMLLKKGIEEVACVFDDETPQYFHKIKIGQHIHPSAFWKPDPAVIQGLPGYLPQP